MDRINGQAAEVALRNIVKEHFTLVDSRDYNKDNLLSNAEICINTFRKDLYTIKQKEGLGIQELSCEDIIDWIYGIDTILETVDETGNKIRVAIDVTTNVTDVQYKLNKLQSRKQAIRNLGIDFCFVVYWDNNIAYKNLTRGQKYAMAGYLLDAIDNSTSKKLWVDDVVIP